MTDQDKHHRYFAQFMQEIAQSDFETVFVAGVHLTFEDLERDFGMPQGTFEKTQEVGGYTLYQGLVMHNCPFHLVRLYAAVPPDGEQIYYCCASDASLAPGFIFGRKVMALLMGSPEKEKALENIQAEIVGSTPIEAEQSLTFIACVKAPRVFEVDKKGGFESPTEALEYAKKQAGVIGEGAEFWVELESDLASDVLADYQGIIGGEDES